MFRPACLEISRVRDGDDRGEIAVHVLLFCIGIFRIGVFAELAFLG